MIDPMKLLFLATHGTDDEKFHVVQVLGNLTAGNIHTLRGMAQCDSIVVREAARGWLSELGEILAGGGTPAAGNGDVTDEQT